MDTVEECWVFVTSLEPSRTGLLGTEQIVTV